MLKKVVSLLLAGALVLTISATALASWTQIGGETGITVNTATAPQTVSAQVNYNSLTLSWSSEGTNAKGFKVAYSTQEPGIWWNIDKEDCFTKIDVGTATSYKIANLKPNTKYYYSVGAYNGDASFGASWTYYKDITTPEPLTAPSGVKYAVKNDSMTLSWNKVYGADSYKIGYSSDNKTFKYVDVGNVNSYKFKDLKYNAKYYFKLVSLKDGLEAGEFGNTVSAATPCYAAPAKITVTKAHNFLTFHWNKVNGVNGYKIAFSNNGKNWKTTNLGNVSSCKYANLASQTKYYVKVAPLINGKVCGNWSKVYYAVTNKCLSAPTNIKVKKTCNTASVTWKKVSGADGYRIEYSLDKKKWTAVNVKNVASAKLTKLKFGSKYYIRMVCLRGGIINGKYSKTYYFTTNALACPAARTNVSSNTVNVSWKSVKGATGYCVQYSKDNKTWISKNVGTKTSYKITGLSPNTKYYVRVYCLQNGQTASSCKKKSVTTGLLSAPKISKLEPHSTSINITWKKIDAASSYTIRYLPVGKTDYKYVNVIGANTYKIKNLTPKTAYSITIQANNKQGRRITKESSSYKLKTLAKNLQYVACPACRGNGRCHNCKGTGKCRICHGTGLRDATHICTSCGGRKYCLICHGHGACITCGGKGKLLVDLNA